MSDLAATNGEPYRKEPFPQRTPFGEEAILLATEAIRSQDLFGLGGPKVTALEQGFAGLYDAEYAVASSSGTAAIHVAVGTLNPNPGDEIITAPITDGGSIVPIIYQGCIPVFADVDETYNMDPADIERKITGRTAAIMVVHLFGNACDMEAITEIARRHNVALIEDCSQAHVTNYRDQYLGTWGDIAAFSLQQSKHMTSGDGGITITNRADWAERMYLFRDKGWTRQAGWGARTYAFLSPNYRMTELQAAVAIPQLKSVRSIVEKRMRLGTHLSGLLGGLQGVTTPRLTEGSEHSYWSYALRIDGWSVSRFASALTSEGVSAGAGYIGEPIYTCMEALASKKTFGDSTYPFDGSHGGRQIEYLQGLCPRAEEMLRHTVTVSFNENYARTDIEDMAGAIRKVADLLPRE